MAISKTPNLNLNVPDYQTPDWNVPVNENWNILDSSHCTCPQLALRLLDVEVVDVFIYDTTKDSDGGAWVDNCSRTSWCNEPLDTAIRGKTRGFPRIVAIVLEATKLTIYDLTDPTVPMWMVFLRVAGSLADGAIWADAVTGRCVTAFDSTICIGTDDVSSRGGVRAICFSEDTAELYGDSSYRHYNGGIAERNVAGTGYLSGAYTAVERHANDIAMIKGEVLSRPIIAIATLSSVYIINSPTGVIHGSGTGSYGKVSFFNGRLTAARSNVPRIHVSSDFLTDNFPYITYREISTPAILPQICSGLVGTHGGGHNGLVLLEENIEAPEKGMVNYITGTYQSGWMQGDIKGAWLADTEEGAVYENHIVDPGFDDAGAWSTNAAYIVDGGKLTGVPGNSANASNIGLILKLTVGKSYTATFTIDSISVNRVFFNQVGGPNGIVRTAPGTYTETFVLDASTTNVGIYINNTDAVIDNFTIIEMVADRSVNENPLENIGTTVTRTPVNTNAELMGYTGFTQNDYLIQAHNNDLDFGTDDFYAMAWVKTNTTGDNYIISLDEATTNNANRLFIYCANGIPTIMIGTILVQATTLIDNDKWSFIVGYRKDGILHISVNGEEEGSIANSTDITNSAHELVVGSRRDENTPWLGSLSLVRMGKGAPSDNQLKKIYEDEKSLFDAGAQCTLQSTSGHITCMEGCEGELYLGTTAGSCVLDNLVSSSLTVCEKDVDGNIVCSDDKLFKAISANKGAVLSGLSDGAVLDSPEFNTKVEVLELLDRVDTIETAMSYNFEKVKNLLDISDTYQPIVSLATDRLCEGIYEIKASVTYSYDRTTKSSFFRWRLDGGAWEEIKKEAKDITDITVSSFFYPTQLSRGVHVLEIEGRKESGGGTFDILFANAIIERKK